jgi:LmbE family N-acetylglucosaminyl deacetylase
LNDRERLCSGFEQEYSRFFTRRAQWLAKQPNSSNSPGKPLDELIPKPGRILVLSPHPDDELIGCGGTMLKYMSLGAEVTIVQLTDGSNCAALLGAKPDFRTTARLREAERVARNLKVDDLRLWSLTDTLFQVDKELVQKMRDLLVELKPDIIFIPFVNDLHHDHVKTNQLLFQALQLTGVHSNVSVCSYETWAVVPGNAFMDTTEFFERKATALSFYPIPMKVVDYIEFCARREAYHHYNIKNCIGFIENFQLLDVPSYLKMMKDES